MAKTPVKTTKKAAVNDVKYCNKTLNFRNKEGLYFRLTFEGVNGWRMQTSKNGKFDSMGVAQALARFMNEKIKVGAQRVAVNVKKDKITLTEKKGTYAVLSLKEDFSLKFCSKDGAVINEVTSVNYDNGSLFMKGALAEQEAIYGGGERLDVSNKRGTQIDLFTCDGWNNPQTTYVVLPLFLTTRGGGMFINRNESALVDFGKAEENTWTYKLRHGDMDCYFYPTGNMADSLLGYTELTGHAYMPTPWMQGMHICRYRPDFWSFDRDLSFDKITDIPEYDKLFIEADGKYKHINDANSDEIDNTNIFYFFNDKQDKYERSYVKADSGKYYMKGPKGNPGGDSCKTIITNFIKNDMKPDVASMEALLWSKCFRDTDEGKAYREDMQKAIDWLHAHGIKAMVYLRAGELDRENIGFKEEYNVHADVTVTNEDGSRTVEENTNQIPWILGTGENPDCGKNGYGGLRAETYLDITNDEAVEWYFDKIWGQMIEMGIDGVKIDFCECMPDGDIQIGKTKTHYNWKNPDRIVAGTEHHAYPVYFISSFYKRMLELREKKGLKDGFMLFSRGGGIGSQRSPYMWAGDQTRTYGKLQEQLLATVNSGLSGHPYMSFDMGSYAYGAKNYFTIGLETESAVFARATEFTAFLTNMQTHGDVRHAYDMTEETKAIYRNFTRLHYELIPYMQKYSAIACKTGMPPVRHLALKYNDDVNVHSMNDEFMLGEGLLIAPIFTEDTFERDVYLPEGSWTNLLTGETFGGGQTVKAKANLGQIPVFLNNDSADKEELLPIFCGANWYEIKNWK